MSKQDEPLFIDMIFRGNRDLRPAADEHFITWASGGQHRLPVAATTLPDNRFEERIRFPDWSIAQQCAEKTLEFLRHHKICMKEQRQVGADRNPLLSPPLAVN